MAEEEDSSLTILEYMSDHSGYKCGYCKSKDTNFSHGMWAHQTTVGDYQDLIDRGWRRSGKYCYKPTMDKTCCPMYTIKCDATQFKMTKSQKKVLKRMHRYLSSGNVKKDSAQEKVVNNECSDDVEGNQEFIKPHFEAKEDLSGVSLQISSEDVAKISNSSSVSSNKLSTPEDVRVPVDVTTEESSKPNQEKKPEKNKGIDPSKPPCRKAKDIRRERREAKLAKQAQEAERRGESPMEIPKAKANSPSPKTLEDFLNEPLPENAAHKLEIRLVRSQPSSSQFVRTFKTAHDVYQQYQTRIHGDSLDRCCETQFKRFLCNSPLQAWYPNHGPSQGFGSFHHQYWLDGQLIAVGVLDILPHCISSVYLYYDPDYSFLSLGTYSSLRELALTRELQRRTPALKWYYMGFYIHSCPKMRYKGKYSPSFLLCPETYVWMPIEKSAPKLDTAKYCRFNEDPFAVDENGNLDMGRVLVLHKQELMRYSSYQIRNQDADDEEEVKEYASLVGAKSAYSMVLYRS